VKKKIAIIGSGIAGLTIANLFKKYSDYEFMIYEKKDNLPLDDGYGIQLSPNSVTILNKIGFERIKDENLFNPSKLNFYSFSLKKICDLNINFMNSPKIKYTTLQRSSLIEFLKDEIYGQNIRFGKRILEVTEIKEKILIKFEDNTNDLVDYIIAADGIFSNTKSLIEKKNYLPKLKKAIAIRSILNSKIDLDIDKKNINLILGSNSHLVIYPINKKNDLNLVCVVRNVIYNLEKTKDIIKSKILNQNKKLEILFEGNYNLWPIYYSPKIFQTSNKKVFYIGDAFNGFLPTMAQGASQSIESAFELFNLLKNNSQDVYNIYYKNRLKRAISVRKRSNFNYFIFHLSTNLAQAFRNIILKFFVKNKTFLKKYIGEIYKS